MSILFIITGGQKQGYFEHYLLKTASFYFLVSITAIHAIENIRTGTQNISSFNYVFMGGLILYFYLIGKLEKKRIIIKVNNRFKNIGTSDNVKMEAIFTIVALGAYILFFYKPEIAINVATMWFYEAIGDIYDTPILKWIFGFIGFFFMLSIIFKGFFATNQLLAKITGSPPPKSPTEKMYEQFGNRPKQENDFDEFEVLEEEEEPTDPDEEDDIEEK